MIDKMDKASLRGACEQWCIDKMLDKLDELVDAVNKLESHKHKITTVKWEMGTSCPIHIEEHKTSEPIMQSEYLNEVNHGELEIDLEKIDLKQVIQEVYKLADRSNFCGKGIEYRMTEIMGKLAPYIEEK